MAAAFGSWTTSRRCDRSARRWRRRRPRSCSGLPRHRARWDNTQDTPVPPEMKVGDNPPEGAIIDYYLAAPASGTITLSINDTAGHVIREYSNVPPTPDPTMANVPEYWLIPPVVLPTTPGMPRI